MSSSFEKTLSCGLGGLIKVMGYKQGVREEEEEEEEALNDTQSHFGPGIAISAMNTYCSHIYIAYAARNGFRHASVKLTLGSLPSTTASNHALTHLTVISFSHLSNATSTSARTFSVSKTLNQAGQILAISSRKNFLRQVVS